MKDMNGNIIKQGDYVSHIKEEWTGRVYSSGKKLVVKANYKEYKLTRLRDRKLLII